MKRILQQATGTKPQAETFNKLVKTLSLVMLLTAVSAALTACDDNDSDPAPAANITISGSVELEDGRPVNGGTVTLLDADKNVIDTTSTDADGNYSFSVNRARHFQVNAQLLFSGGAEATASTRIDTASPSEGQAQMITLPDYDQHQLVMIGNTANGPDIRIENLPAEVSRVWAGVYSGEDTRLLAGETINQDTAFASAGFFWLSAADENGNEVDTFNPGLDITVTLPDRDFRLLTDTVEGNGQIDVATYTYDEAAGFWRDDSVGILVDSTGAPLPEAALASIQDGSFNDPLILKFSAMHFSCRSASLFSRIGLPDFGDANVAPSLEIRRPQVANSNQLNYSDVWLGEYVTGEEQPRLPDHDDGMLTCGSETTVAVTYRQSPVNPQTPSALLQVFNTAPGQVDREGGFTGGSGDFSHDGNPDIEWTLNDLTLHNEPVNGFSGGALQTAYVTLPTSHTSGYTRIIVSDSSYEESTLVNDTLLAGVGEIEDYLNNCHYVLRVNVDGGDNDVIQIEDRQCTTEGGDECSEVVTSDETETLSAMRNGQPISVEWSVILQRRLGLRGECADGPTCSIEKPDGPVDLAGGLVTARFPEPPELRTSVIGQGAVTGSEGQINCDASDPNQAPTFDDCRGTYSDGINVTLSQTAATAAGFEFERWFLSGATSCSEGSFTGDTCTINMLSDAREGATARFRRFPELQFTTGAGGTVRSSPEGIVCRGDGERDGDTFNCSYRFPTGSTVTLTAEPESGQGVLDWSGACADTVGEVCSITVAGDDNNELEAGVRFVPSARVNLAVSGDGSVSSEPAGINCSESTQSDCEETYVSGTQVSFNAAPNPGSGFVEYTGACANAFDGACTLTLNNDVSFTARFAPLFDLNVSVSGSGGFVNGTGSISNCDENGAFSGNCQETYTEGTEVTLTASAFEGNEFAGWGGACEQAAGNPSCVFSISEDSEVTAGFVPVVQNYTITLVCAGTAGSAGDNQTETLLCNSSSSQDSATFAEGSFISFFAVPEGDSDGFSYTNYCSGDSCEFTVVEDATVEVTFTASGGNSGSTNTLTANFTGTGEGHIREDTITTSRFYCDSSSAPCSVELPADGSISLVANPESTSDEFVQWTSGPCTGSTSSYCTVDMSSDQTVGVEFTKVP